MEHENQNITHSKKNVWQIVSGVLAALVVVCLVILAMVLTSQNKINESKATEIFNDFVLEAYGPQLHSSITIKEITFEHGLYKFTLSLPDTEGTVVEDFIYLSADGELFITQAINIEEALAQARAIQQQIQNGDIQLEAPAEGGAAGIQEEGTGQEEGAAGGAEIQVQ
jgi:hypothetical protein